MASSGARWGERKVERVLGVGDIARTRMCFLSSMGLAIGCGKILGVDAYDVGPGPASDGGTHALPILPALSATASAECRRCADSQCGNERDACRSNKSCRTMLDCVGNCLDPNC